MGHRMEKVNRHIERVFGEILLKEAEIPPNVLLTVSRVDTAPNLRSTAIWLYIQPSQEGEKTLRLLEEQLYDLQGALNRELNMHPLPRITLHIDLGAEYAARVEEKLARIKDEDSPTAE